MSLRKFNYLIVGQGLAGSILAHQLINAGNSVLVLDNDHEASSSAVAAGIINPITGHRLNITDGFAEFYPNAEKYYADLEQVLGVDLWRTIDQLRLIKNQGQLEYFHKRQDQHTYKNLIGNLEDTPYFPKATFGATRIAKTAVVNTATLLQAIKTWLMEHESYESTKVDYAKFQFSNNGVIYGKHTASKLIFCEGFQAINNPWLQYLPFKLSKGEVLTIKAAEQPKELLNWGNWLLPDALDGSCKLGSNYAWNDTNLAPDPLVKNQLLEGLTEATGFTAKLTKHQVGIRPTTKYRKPFIGVLKQLEHALCFNGFGSKGCLLIPYYAKLLVDHLTHGTPLPKELSEHL